MTEKIKALLKNPGAQGLIQFIKFGLVGVSNTAISYSIDMLCYYVLFSAAQFSGTLDLLEKIGITSTGDTVKIVYTTALAFIVSVTNSYYWNSRYVFKSGHKRTAGQHAKAYLKTVACYGVTGLVLAPIIKVWLGGLGVPYWVASLLSLLVTIPLNFVLNKFWAFGGKKSEA